MALVPERVVSIHYPKAGGTSLLDQMREAVGDDMLFYNDPDIFGNRTQDLAPFPDGKRLVHGHFKATRYQSSDAFMFTFLRHPIDGLLSWYFYWMQHPGMGGKDIERFHLERPTVVEFAATDRYAVMMSEVFFGDFDMGRLDFIGAHETRKGDLEQLSRRLGVSLRADIHSNQTAPNAHRDEILGSPSTLAELRRVLAQDIDFYEAALSRRKGH